jgi:hypothetical protein
MRRPHRPLSNTAHAERSASYNTRPSAATTTPPSAKARAMFKRPEERARPKTSAIPHRSPAPVHSPKDALLRRWCKKAWITQARPTQAARAGSSSQRASMPGACTHSRHGCAHGTGRQTDPRHRPSPRQGPCPGCEGPWAHQAHGELRASRVLRTPGPCAENACSTWSVRSCNPPRASRRGSTPGW